ncbi:MAG: aminoacyl-tRNA hydrolase [Firmicutes bacterium]|nr:aminoacyl-tRNA hydrolase [Bacillota bacterium]
MKMIVGLGNPGTEYIGTRHNVGFDLVDRLADRFRVSVKKAEGKALTVAVNHADEKVLLVKPQTYMNRSGQAVAALADYYRINLKDILVIYDDMDLPVGKIRLRYKGGAGTHNGMRSVIEELGSEEFPRLRIGIDRPAEGNWADYVLGRFEPEELEPLRKALELGEEAVLTFITEGIERAMNEYNRK